MSLKQSLSLCSARRITVYCPVSRDGWLALLAGDATRLETEPGIAPLFDVLRSHPEFGSLGPYRSVYEVTGGHESFTPGAGARPTLGRPGEVSTTVSVAVTTYVSGAHSEARLAELVRALAQAHPWELPVIEVTDVRVLEAPDRPHPASP